jgi:hypothetical protein
MEGTHGRSRSSQNQSLSPPPSNVRHLHGQSEAHASSRRSISPTFLPPQPVSICVLHLIFQSGVWSDFIPPSRAEKGACQFRAGFHRPFQRLFVSRFTTGLTVTSADDFPHWIAGEFRPAERISGDCISCRMPSKRSFQGMAVRSRNGQAGYPRDPQLSLRFPLSTDRSSHRRRVKLTDKTNLSTASVIYGKWRLH